MKNRTDEATEAAVIQYALDEPAHGQTRTSNELRKKGVFISPSGVRCVWLRHGLACFRDRLKALEAKVAAEGIVLSESQVAAWSARKRMMWPVARSRRPIRATWVRRTPSTSAL